VLPETADSEILFGKTSLQIQTSIAMTFTIVVLVLVLSQSHPTAMLLGNVDIWRTMCTIMIALTSGMINTHSTTPSTAPDIY